MTTQIQVMNVDLYRLAAQYYGNADKWYIIANANGLNDPIVAGPQPLDIPDLPTNDTGDDLVTY